MDVRNMVPWGRGNRLAPQDQQAHPFLALQRDVNRLFEEVFRGFELPSVFSGRSAPMPSIEVRDEGKELKVVAELPGMTEQDVELSLDDDTLILRGEKKAETSEKTETGVFTERWFGRFERMIDVGEVQEDKVTAEFKDGVLTVILPKAEETIQHARKIPIAKT